MIRALLTVKPHLPDNINFDSFHTIIFRQAKLSWTLALDPIQKEIWQITYKLMNRSGQKEYV